MDHAERGAALPEVRQKEVRGPPPLQPRQQDGAARVFPVAVE